MDNEKVYDEQIAPLMMQVIEICKENKIPVVASFQLNESEDPKFCTTVLNVEKKHTSLFDLVKILFYSHTAVPTTFGMTISKR